MDNDGLWQRRSKSIPVKTIVEWLSEREIEEYFEKGEKMKDLTAIEICLIKDGKT